MVVFLVDSQPTLYIVLGQIFTANGDYVRRIEMVDYLSTVRVALIVSLSACIVSISMLILTLKNVSKTNVEVNQEAFEYPEITVKELSPVREENQ